MVGQTERVLGRERVRLCQDEICKLDLLVRAKPWRDGERCHEVSGRVSE